MNKTISILGITGSIGKSAQDVADKLGLHVLAGAANTSVDDMEACARRYKLKYACMYDYESYRTLKIKLSDTNTHVLHGMDGLCTIASDPDNDILLNSLVGMIGLKPTLAAIDAGVDVALANKETLVAAGALVMGRAREKGVRILPVDSEHSAIFQCLSGNKLIDDIKTGINRKNHHNTINRLILTASGGPFFGMSADELAHVTPEQALRHPNWSMGAKITIDCATLMNKGLELIEAVWLFDLPEDKIDVLVHRESIIHSIVEYEDNSSIAQLSVPDMRIPIQYALTYPMRYPSPVKPLNLWDMGKLTFARPDDSVFVCLAACREAIKRGGLYPAIVNAADELAVGLYLDGKLPFTGIGELVLTSLEHFDGKKDRYSYEDVTEIDRDVREKLGSGRFITINGG